MLLCIILQDYYKINTFIISTNMKKEAVAAASFSYRKGILTDI